MEDRMTEEEIYEEAKRRVKAKKEFYSHLFSYIVVNVFLFCMWYFVTGRGYPWFAWILGFWGFGLLSHFMGVFVWDKSGSKSAIEKEAARIRRQQDR